MNNKNDLNKNIIVIKKKFLTQNELKKLRSNFSKITNINRFEIVSLSSQNYLKYRPKKNSLVYLKYYLELRKKHIQ